MSLKTAFGALLYKKQLNTRRNALFWLFVFVPPLAVAVLAAFVVDTQSGAWRVTADAVRHARSR